MVSSAVLAQAVGHGVALVVGYYAPRYGFHVDATQSAEIAGVASMVVGPMVGHLVKVKPAADAEAAVNEFEKLFTVVAESGANPRSALNGSVTPAAPSVAPDTSDGK